MGEQVKQRLSKEVDDFVVLFVYFLLFVLFFSHFHFIAYLTLLYSKVMQTSFLRPLEPSVKKITPSVFTVAFKDGWWQCFLLIVYFQFVIYSLYFDRSVTPSWAMQTRGSLSQATL